MNEARGQHVLDFARNYLKLYEGDKAGQPLEPMAWQIEFVMRLFGWERHSDKWGGKVRRFRQASIWVPKKNGKSPTLAWLALYLLCSDGEPGQKVYLAAVDGQQAREIAGKHVIEMVAQSPQLQAVCRINKSLLQVTHEPTRSILKPISSSDAKVQKAKEGLNGCVLVDETHVVNREFMGRVSRAGISRSEPLQIEVSTAGDDPDGYGKERYDYGRSVNETGGNEQLLFIAWEAPAELSDEALAADPLKYGKESNPAWGETIDPTEFIADYESSKQSAVELARFKMYRLNIWQKAANPWLRVTDWDACRKDYTRRDLLGLPCYAGLDLSKVRDLTALVFVFPWEDGAVRLWPMFVMPEGSARKRNHLKPYLQWAKDGHLILTPGDVCDYGFVRKAFREATQEFNVRQLLYDPWQAEETTQAMEQGVVVEGVEIETGTGVPRVLFKQALANFAGPTEEFEKMVIEGRLHHPGNPVLDWQAGHVTVYMDANRNKRPIKPKTIGAYKSIDGIVAGIMGLAGVMKNADHGSVYDRRGIAFIGADESKKPVPVEVARTNEPQWATDWLNDDD